MEQLVDINVDGEQVTLENEVGRGASSIVYRGYWAHTLVAVKRIVRSLSSDDDVVEAFLRETLLMSKLRHPNVLQLYAASVHEDGLLMLTEYCSRGSLRELLATPSIRLSYRLRRRVATMIARGMLYLHSKVPAIIHRDLHAKNVLLTDSWQVKIADFGLSVVSDGSRAHMTMCGTATHSAPEVLRGQLYTVKADVYSFAVLLWQLLTGETVYPNMQLIEVVSAVRDGALRPPLPHVDVSPSFEAIIKACWHDGAAQRPSFSRILELLEATPASASTVASTAVRTARQHRLLSSSASLSSPSSSSSSSTSTTL
jgi:serine/threonine protein kinase